MWRTNETKVFAKLNLGHNKEKSLYFLALIPPNPIFEELEAMKRALSEVYHTQTALRSPPHITLHMPFHKAPEAESAMIDQLSTFFIDQSPFSVQVKGFACFAPRVLYAYPLPSEALTALQRSLLHYLRDEMAIYHEKYFNTPFVPHMTLANRDIQRKDFDKAWTILKSQSYERTFMADQAYILKLGNNKWKVLPGIPFGNSRI